MGLIDVSLRTGVPVGFGNAGLWDAPGPRDPGDPQVVETADRRRLVPARECGVVPGHLGHLVVPTHHPESPVVGAA